MPEYLVSFTDKMGSDIVVIGGPGWVYSTDEAGFLIQRRKADFYVQVGDHKVMVRAIPHEKFGRHWDLTTETEDSPFNDLAELPVRHTI